MSHSLAPKLLAEFIGTFAFVFIGAGAAAVVGDGVGLPGIVAIAFNLFNADQKKRLFNNIAEAMHGVPIEIVKRQIGHFYKADPEYGIGVATRMGLSASNLPAAQAAE